MSHPNRMPSISNYVPQHTFLTPSFSLPSGRVQPSSKLPPLLTIETRIYHNLTQSSLLDPTPSSENQKRKQLLRLAVLAHPYAPLGGSFNDHVLLSLVDSLLNQNICDAEGKNKKLPTLVSTFNFRGAGRSAGKTSWSGEGEKEDYMAVIGAVGAVAGGLMDGYASKAKDEEVELKEKEAAMEMEMTLAGYSYGSLILSRLPCLQEIFSRVEKCETIEDGGIYRNCLATCKEYGLDLAREVINLSSMGRYPNKKAEENTTSRMNKANTRNIATWSIYLSELNITPRYLLISPLLPPLTTLLSLPSISLSFPSFSYLFSGKKKQEQQRDSTVPLPPGSIKRDLMLCSPENEHMCEVKILVIHGDTDIFTSVSKYREWKRKWIGEPEFGASHVEKHNRIVVEIKGAGHFWIEEGALDKLLQAIKEWISEG